MPLRVGVTGHRRYQHADRVRAAIRQVIESLATEAEDGMLEVWSSLAEGADRDVAECVLARDGARLTAVLPLPLNDYATDCVDDSSAQHLTELVARAATVEVTAGGGDRPAAYERAGRRVLERCEVLVAVWDGRPARGRGGTAEIVAEARRMGRRTVVVQVDRTEASEE